jgi:hypothetical protein
MLKLKRTFPFLMIPVLALCSFLAGRAMAQQPLPYEQPAPYSFPRAWGDLREVTQSTGGFSYVFVNSGDGTIRLVQANGAGVANVQVINRR